MLRFCSTMGTVLLALSLTSPALAKKKKKTSDDSAESSQSSDSGSSKKKGKSDSASSGSSEGEGTTAASGSGEAEKAPAMADDSWERPPMEEEKPIGPPPKPVEKKAGDGRPWSAGLLVGWAFKTDRSTSGLGADPYGFGFGIRGGYTFDFKLYVGLFYMYYLGSSTNSSCGRSCTSINLTPSANYMQFGAEVGYDVWAGPVIIRPSLEFGPALALTDVSGTSTSVTRAVIAPGLTIVHPMGGFFIGGEGRANIVPSANGISALLVAVHAGLRFE
jgi:hypothetical protein